MYGCVRIKFSALVYVASKTKIEIVVLLQGTSSFPLAAKALTKIFSQKQLLDIRYVPKNLLKKYW